MRHDGAVAMRQRAGVAPMIRDSEADTERQHGGTASGVARLATGTGGLPLRALRLGKDITLLVDHDRGGRLVLAK